MKIIADYATTSACYRAGTTITPRGLMLHVPFVVMSPFTVKCGV